MRLAADRRKYRHELARTSTAVTKHEAPSGTAANIDTHQRANDLSVP
ncbi:MAG: hypothetical protein SPJ68_02420 [Arcanobacterium sp.]|nr:hypothetical protein [Arcanobacterium sp.]